MAQTVTLTAKGLELTRNDLSSGGLAAADNCVLGRDGILECRPGFTVASVRDFTRLFPFKGRVLGSDGVMLSVSSADVTTWTDYGAYFPPAGQPMRTVEACQNLYFTGLTGPYRLDSIAGTPQLAGVPAALDVQAEYDVADASGPLPGGSQLAYRVVWGKRDANERLLLGAPSGRAIVANAAGSATRKVDIQVTVPRNVDSTYFWQLYRSAPSVDENTPPDDELALVYEAPAPAAVSVSSLTRTGGVTVTATTAAPHGWPIGMVIPTVVSISPGGTGSGGSVFAAGEKTITVTDATHFTYVEAGANGTLGTAQTVIPISIGYVDTGTYLQAALYTNPSQEGIEQAAERPPLARDLAEFKGHTFYLATQDPPTVLGSLVGLPTAGDTITINGTTYTADATEDVAARKFLIGVGGLPSVALSATVRSLVRVINRSRVTNFVAFDLADADTVGTRLAFRALAATTTMTVSVSRASSWLFSGGTTATPKERKANLRWSKAYEPDAVPLLANEATLGSEDKAGLRVISTRDAVYVLKEDGVYIVRGDSAPWDIRPLDPTIELVAPETATAFDNSVWALTEQGVVRISDTGVTVMSRAIESALLPLIGPAMRATTALYAFAVGYESERKYILWLPSSASDTKATQAYCYDLFTQQWTRWDTDAAHALVNPADDRLYIADGTSVLQERKGYAASDYQDASGAAIPVLIQWSPQTSNPGALHLFQELGITFRAAGFATATVSFATDTSPAWESVTLTGSNYGLDGGPRTIRVGIPREKSRGGQLRVKFEHSQASAPVALQAMELTYRAGSTRVGR